MLKTWFCHDWVTKTRRSTEEVWRVLDKTSWRMPARCVGSIIPLECRNSIYLFITKPHQPVHSQLWENTCGYYLHTCLLLSSIHFFWHFGIEDPPLRKGCGAQQPYALHQEDLGKLYIIGRSLRRCCQILPAQDMVKAIGGELDSWRLESSIPLIIHNHHVFEWMVDARIQIIKKQFNLSTIQY